MLYVQVKMELLFHKKIVPFDCDSVDKYDIIFIDIFTMAPHSTL